MSASEITSQPDGHALVPLIEALLDEVRALRQDARAREAREGLDALITQEEFAAILGVNARTMRRLQAKGELPPSISLTSRPRWRRSDVERFLKGLKGSR